jgi:hypothetical protein
MKQITAVGRFAHSVSAFRLPPSSLSSMFDLDPFQFFRLTVAWIATIYASVITLQSLYGWVVYLSGGDKYMTMVRRYLIIHALRLRFKTFWGDVIICVLLTVIFFLLWRLHTVLVPGV